MRTMPAGEFKAKCLAIMAEVNSTGQPILITKRGKPLAQILPSNHVPPEESPEAIFGCLRSMGAQTGDITPARFTVEEWDRLFHSKWALLDQGNGNEGAAK